MTGNPFHSTANLKFAFYSISTDLGAKPAPKHLEPINYDRCSHLNSRAQLETSLTAPESQELSALEEENMKTIEKAYQRLRDDKEIQAQIERIKAHPWVRVVEGDE